MYVSARILCQASRQRYDWMSKRIDETSKLKFNTEIYWMTTFAMKQVVAES